jgi:hypothetical protein
MIEAQNMSRQVISLEDGTILGVQGRDGDRKPITSITDDERRRYVETGAIVLHGEEPQAEQQPQATTQAQEPRRSRERAQSSEESAS